MTVFIGFGVLAIAGALCVVAAFTLARTTSELTRARASQQGLRLVAKTDDADEYDVHVETIFVPPSGDWAASIQKQLDAIEGRDPRAELVSGVTVNGRIVLFYRRKKRGAA